MGGGGSDVLREGKTGPSQDASPCLGEGHSVKASPFLGIYLLGTGGEEPYLGGAAPPVPLPPCLATLPPLFVCATVMGLGGEQRGQVWAGLRGKGAMVEAWGQ